MSIWAVIKRGLCLRCPSCGKGKVYKGFLSVNDSCGSCGLALKKHDAADGPAYVVMSLMAIKITVLALWLEFAVEPPMWLHALLWIPLTIGGSLILLRFTKAVFIAIQYHYNAREFQ